MRIEVIRIAVEHRAYILNTGAPLCRQLAGCGHKMADIRIVRPELECFDIGVCGFVMPSETGQCVAFQAEEASIGDTAGAGLVRKTHSGLAVVTAHRE